MEANPKGLGIGRVFCLLFGIVALCLAGDIELDKSRYITVDEIKPGMEAYCLTCYEGTKVEKFKMKVLDVLHNARIGCDEILVEGIDERFKHTGPVHGCSGSPVYIDGRIAGALARGWSYCKDPLYRVTAIEDMLKIGQGGVRATSGTTFSIDFTKPLDFAVIEERVKATFAARQAYQSSGNTLSLPISTSGLNQTAFARANEYLKPMGFYATDAPAGSLLSGSEDIELEPGASLAVPLVTGDISMSALGTATDVVGDKVYGFGHQFLGFGAVDLPIATARVHTVVSNMVSSFKLGSPSKIIGALHYDDSSGIMGRIGDEAKMMPMTITIDNCNDIKERTYNCKVAYNRELTPMVLASALSGATCMVGELPLDHRLDYSVSMELDNGEELEWSNVSTSEQLRDFLREVIGSMVMVMNNPFEEVGIESLNCKVAVKPQNDSAHIRSASISDTVVKAGETVKVEALIESVRGCTERHSLDIEVPQDLAPGQYKVLLTGGPGYLNFMRQNAPQRFTYRCVDTLLASLKNTLGIKRDKLFLVLMLPPDGVTVENAELPHLPATRAMVFQNSKRSVETMPYNNWSEQSVETGVVVADSKEMQITVEN